MENVNIRLHYYQAAILRKLTLHPKARFNELLIKGLESEHMNYHLKKLIQFGFVSKDKAGYILTDNGKDYSNMLNDDVKTIEKQPKTSVLVRGVRKRNNNEVEHLLNKRLRHPYYGMVGRIGGKVRFGESLREAAERELFEETGLKADYYKLEEIYRKIRHREDGTKVQDVFFYIFLVKDFSGDLIRETEFQENLWVTKRELHKRTDLEGFDDLELDDRMEPKELEIVENKNVAVNF